MIDFADFIKLPIEGASMVINRVTHRSETILAFANVHKWRHKAKSFQFTESFKK